MYDHAITRTNPGCIIFLLDRSEFMHTAWGDGGQTLAEGAAAAVNEVLLDLCLRSTLVPGLMRHFYDVGVIGYGLRPDGGGEGVELAFGGGLAGRPLVAVPDLRNHPLATRVSSAGEGPALRRPVWVDPVHGHGAPMCRAIAVAGGLASEWASVHPDSFPPVVINVTAGLATDSPYEGASLRAWAKRLTSIATGDGPALLFNAILCQGGETGKLFPASDSGLTEAECELFGVSSVLPEFMIETTASYRKVSIPAGARGFALSAGSLALDKFLAVVSHIEMAVGLL
jgi:hypothetical protein